MIATPLLITDVLSGLGFGQRVLVAASLILVVLYALKGRRTASTVAGLMGTAWFAVVVVAVAFAIAILAGWVDPSPAKFWSDVVAGATNIYHALAGPVDEWVRSLIDGVL